MILIFRAVEVTFPYIFDVKMLIVANIFKDFHHHHSIGAEENANVA